ncbi:MAG: hypothetical protein JWR26_433 [Pedosphaera sp.]|nr:hypothetical protein [Pedosphaera sp.]
MEAASRRFSHSTVVAVRKHLCSGPRSSRAQQLDLAQRTSQPPRQPRNAASPFRSSLFALRLSCPSCCRLSCKSCQNSGSPGGRVQTPRVPRSPCLHPSSPPIYAIFVISVVKSSPPLVFQWPCASTFHHVLVEERTGEKRCGRIRRLAFGYCCRYSSRQRRSWHVASLTRERCFDDPDYERVAKARPRVTPSPPSNIADEKILSSLSLVDCGCLHCLRPLHFHGCSSVGSDSPF